MTTQEIISKHRTAIMGFAMMSIMLFHQPFFYNNPLVDFYHLYGAWGVPVFLFVSGFGIVHSLNKNSIKVYYKNRLTRMLPACLLAGVGKYVFVQMGFVEFSSLNILFLITSIYLWYIYAIIVYYILAPFLYKCIKKSGLVVLITVCALSYGCTFIPFEDSEFYLVNHIGWITGSLPVFVLGMIYATYPINIDVKKTVIIGVIFYVVCLVLQLGSIMVRFQWKVPYLNLLLSFATPMLCILASYMDKIVSRVKLSWLPMFFGTLSLELYLWHEYIFWNLFKDERFASMNMFIKCALAVGVSILLAYLTHLLAKFIQNKGLNRSKKL